MIPFRLLSGKIIDLDDLQNEDININNIAHALAMQCRYNGQIKEFYSVAQHSVFVSDYLFEETEDREIALCGLLHDAAEAYLGDIVTPIKKELCFFNLLEETMLSRILHKYHLSNTYRVNQDLIKKADNFIYEKEVDYFFGSAMFITNYNKPVDIKSARTEFIRNFIDCR